jgi:hypothetical protein
MTVVEFKPRPKVLERQLIPDEVTSYDRNLYLDEHERLLVAEKLLGDAAELLRKAEILTDKEFVERVEKIQGCLHYDIAAFIGAARRLRE